MRATPEIVPAVVRIARALSFVEGFTLMPVEVTGPDLGRALAAWLEARGDSVPRESWSRWTSQGGGRSSRASSMAVPSPLPCRRRR